MTNETTGIIFNVQRFTIHDGPGIRTELFLKGCNLRCDWCSNPESFIKQPQIGFYGNTCIGTDICGDCATVCDAGGLIIHDNKVVGTNRNACTNCLSCFKECPSDALKKWGDKLTVTEAMDIIRRDKNYYKENNGGVTLSGGEALLQPKFVKEVFKQCREEGIHTCLETALHVKPEVLDDVLPYTDMIITDIKHMNTDIHKARTGVHNEQILSNMKKIAKFKNTVVVLRIPVIPNFNADEKSINDIGDFILNEMNNNIAQLQLLRYRPLGIEKYEALGIDYTMSIDKERSEFEQEIREYVEMLKKKNIPVFTGSTNTINIKK